MQFIGFEMLQDTLGKNVKRLTLQLHLQSLTPERINQLGDIVRNHKGNTTLMVDVFHDEEQIKLTLPSRKKKVEVSNELLALLESEGLSYKLN